MESVSRGSEERETRIPGAVSVLEGDGEVASLLIGVGVVVVVAVFDFGGGVWRSSDSGSAMSFEAAADDVVVAVAIGGIFETSRCRSLKEEIGGWSSDVVVSFWTRSPSIGSTTEWRLGRRIRTPKLIPCLHD